MDSPFLEMGFEFGSLNFLLISVAHVRSMLRPLCTESRLPSVQAPSPSPIVSPLDECPYWSRCRTDTVWPDQGLGRPVTRYITRP